MQLLTNYMQKLYRIRRKDDGRYFDSNTPTWTREQSKATTYESIEDAKIDYTWHLQHVGSTPIVDIFIE